MTRVHHTYPSVSHCFNTPTQTPISTAQMSSEIPEVVYSPFLLITPRLIILPTPSALHVRQYRDLYAHLHSLTEFCEMGFGDTYPARYWDEEARYKEIEREIKKNWNSIGLGDMAVGFIPKNVRINILQIGRKVSAFDNDAAEVRIMEGEDYKTFVDNGRLLGNIKWVGYTGIRDARNGMPDPPDGEPPLPDWKELTEVRYGISPDYWDKGIATEATKAAMHWAVYERSVQRFIAETQKANSRSGAILKKLGFTESRTNYWQEPSYLEWEMRVVRPDRRTNE